MAFAPAASAGSLFWLTVRPGHSSDPLLVTHPLPDPTSFAMCFFHRKKKKKTYIACIDTQVGLQKESNDSKLRTVLSRPVRRRMHTTARSTYRG